jgi:organic hydroperoxide reductase OsmC/OhrA
MKTHGSASWKGGLKDGKGAISTQSGALKEYPYGFASRFEGKPGTNPEELIGAAHAGCFTMALSLILGEAQLTAAQLDTKAEVAGKSARWIRHHGRPPDLESQGAGRGPSQIRGTRCQSQGGLSRV